MELLKVFLAKSVLQALIKDTDLENPFHGEKIFVRLATELANYAIR